MKKYISLVVIPFTILFFTNDICAQKKYTSIEKEFGVEISGGSRANLKGVDFTSSLNLSGNRMQYALQYNYYGYNYAKLDNIYLHEYLEYAHTLGFLAGYKIPTNKFSILPMTGICIGRGRFANTESYDEGYIYGMIGDNTTYKKRDFLGLVLKCDLKYRITDHIGAGITFTTSMNHIFNHPALYYGLQLSSGYIIKDWKKYHPLDTAKKRGKWEISLAGGVNYGKVAIKTKYSTIKNYSSYKTIWANQVNLSCARIFKSGVSLRLTFLNKRITFEHIYGPGGPLSKSKTWYDLLEFNISSGYNYNFKRFSFNNYLGIGIVYLLKKAELRTSLNGISWDPDYYDFHSGWGKKDIRLTIPVSFSLGIDYHLNRLLSISLTSGIDYNLTPFVLYRDGANDFGYITHYIYQYSIFNCLGIKYKIGKD